MSLIAVFVSSCRDRRGGDEPDGRRAVPPGHVAARVSGLRHQLHAGLLDGIPRGAARLPGHPHPSKADARRHVSEKARLRVAETSRKRRRNVRRRAAEIRRRGGLGKRRFNSGLSVRWIKVDIDIIAAGGVDVTAV